MNIGAYIHWRYIPQFLCRLTEEYNVYSSVMKVCSSVVTDERSCVSCSEGTLPKAILISQNVVPY
jgi:hypothetical protein